MTTMSVQRVGFACGARVTGIDLSRPLPDDAIRAIHTAWLKHLVLVFPTLVEFTRRFGQLDDYAFNRHPDINEVMVITNKRTNGRPSKTYNNGQNWHTDLSYTLRPAKGTSVYCMERPSVGGDTMFANMYLAYETLSPNIRAFLDGLEAIHDASLIEGLDARGPEALPSFDD